MFTVFELPFFERTQRDAEMAANVFTQHAAGAQSKDDKVFRVHYDCAFSRRWSVRNEQSRIGAT